MVIQLISQRVVRKLPMGNANRFQTLVGQFALLTAAKDEPYILDNFTSQCEVSFHHTIHLCKSLNAM